VAEQPDNGGDLRVARHGDVTLTLSDGRRLVLPSTVKTPGVRGLLCRTRNLNRADGSTASPCHLQAFVAHGRAVWLQVVGKDMVGTAVMGSDRWLALADGTALPLPSSPRHPLVNCRGLDRSDSVKVFSHTHHLVLVSTNDDGTVARVSCLSSDHVK
jgi:hypothetical protein